MVGRVKTQMKRARFLTLICGVMCAAMGGALLFMRDQVEAVVGQAVAIIAFGLVLVGIWLRSAIRRPGPPEDSIYGPSIHVPQYSGGIACSKS